MRYGKPIKNKRRVNPRYFLNEEANPEVEKLIDQMNQVLNGGQHGGGFSQLLQAAVEGKRDNAAAVEEEAGYIDKLLVGARKLLGVYSKHELETNRLEGTNGMIPWLGDAKEALHFKNKTDLIAAKDNITDAFSYIVSELLTAGLISKRPWGK